MYQLEAT